MTVEMPDFSYKSLALSMNGVMGSWSLLMIFCIRSSLTMKLVAEVSSSIRKTRLPASIPSMTAAAWEVLPLASSVEKQRVSFFVGQIVDKQGDVHILDASAVLCPQLHGSGISDDIFPSIPGHMVVDAGLQCL